MLSAKIFANAVTTVWLIGYLVCAALAFFSPGVFFRIAGSWFHAINIEAIRASEPMPIMTFLAGVVSFGVYVWILTFAVVSLYNLWMKKFKKV